MSGLRLAVGQGPVDIEPSDRLEWLASVLPHTKGADLLALPELFACGYNIGALIEARAEPSDGPTAQEIGALATRYNVAIHYGFAERAGTVIYNAAQCVLPGGKIVGRHRKLAIPPGFERNYFTPGAGCAVFQLGGVTIGTLICYDAEFPETARHVAGLGADLVLVPTALGAKWNWVANRMIPTRAYENGVYLAYANSAGSEAGMTYLGHSFIAAPNGSELARAGADPELIYAEIDPSRVRAARKRLPYLADRHRIALDPDGAP